MTQTAPTTPSPLLTIEQAATYLQLSELTIRRRISDGTLPAYRWGRAVRIRQEDIDAIFSPVGPYSGL
ncbi:helix-turn-helix domain-containing protein [Corynebacterium sp. HMSC14H10]|uniref:helix-turn-helix domain-containing protein n=1 Tax=Corynebacterium sp. HMSC14H10 TaxID=1581103 RepID=UPI0008A364E9|nr:helix-turn-helix domain-containing protein [Corynebacterium sp. HMSC14H10]OFU60014.1 hypothetical protein HMPREF3135_08915 [Corynebacterium sp. HMSC14H10]